MKKKASRAWKRPLAGLLTLAMVVCLLSSAPLSASASEPDDSGMQMKPENDVE